MTRPTAAARPFKYTKPAGDSTRQLVKLARTDRMVSLVQVFKKGGGERTLHSHKHFDGFWMVLRGRADFYGEGDVLIASLGPLEGVLVPRELPYWFENGADEDLELLQVEAFDIALPLSSRLSFGRTDLTERSSATEPLVMTDAASA